MSAGAVMSPDQILEFKGLLTNLKSQYEKIDTDVKTLGKADSDTLVKVDKVTEDLVAFQSRFETDGKKRMDAIEVQLKDLRAAPVASKSFGEMVCAQAAFVDYLKSGANHGFSMTIPAGAALRRGLTKDISGLSALLPQTLPGISIGPRLPIGVRSLVPQGNTTAGAISYLQETAFTNLANVVAETTAKPKSDKTFAEVVTPVTTIAHYFKVSKQSYEDIPGLSALIEQNGIYGVQLKEDQQLLNGTGIAPQLRGFNTVATAAPAPDVGSTLIDAIGMAVFDLAGKGYVPDGAVVNPTDYGNVAMLKNTQGNYLFANPIDYTGIPRVWGVRLQLSSQQAAGTGLVGAFQGNSLILDRENVNVQVATQNESDFTTNMLTILIEERLALLIFQVAAFEKIVVPAPVVGVGTTTREARPRA